ncbi:MAG TPA: YdcF family protein [Candidatus Saccharimonadales bacterium]|nr:YdcF family protein [Candidatus Saccharimonadales bacterium]
MINKYNVVIVLCGGLSKTAGVYAPTSFSDSDEFGMLGATVRVRAAQELYWRGVADTFLFSTGVSEKQIAKFGPNVPPESHIYRDYFLAGIKNDHRKLAHEPPAPKVLVEDASVNTVANLLEVSKLCSRYGWNDVAIISSAYHVPRIEALYGLIRDHFAISIRSAFLSAEEILRQSQPGVYDNEIAEAYASIEGKRRIANEQQGLAAINSGNYVFHEFQLTN